MKWNVSRSRAFSFVFKLLLLLLFHESPLFFLLLSSSRCDCHLGYYWNVSITPPMLPLLPYMFVGVPLVGIISDFRKKKYKGTVLLLLFGTTYYILCRYSSSRITTTAVSLAVCVVLSFSFSKEMLYIL